MFSNQIHPDLLTLARPIDTLTPDPRNLRLHSERNLQAIVDSLKAHGQRKPVVAQVANGATVVRAGNGTLEAARRLGWTHLAVVAVEETDDEAVAFAIRDNRTAELAGWDYEGLMDAVEQLEEQAVPIASLGFEDHELDKIVQEMAAASADLEGSDAASGSITQTPAERFEEWQRAGIRSVILPYSVEVYEGVAARLKAGRKAFGLDSNAELVVAMLDRCGIEVKP